MKHLAKEVDAYKILPGPSKNECYILEIRNLKMRQNQSISSQMKEIYKNSSGGLKMKAQPLKKLSKKKDVTQKNLKYFSKNTLQVIRLKMTQLS